MHADDYTIIFCPHCGDPVVIYHVEVNCAIFRHGAYRHNDAQMNPHESKEECDRLFREGLIYGCGRPFRVVRGDGGGSSIRAEVCDYI